MSPSADRELPAPAARRPESLLQSQHPQNMAVSLEQNPYQVPQLPSLPSQSGHLPVSSPNSGYRPAQQMSPMYPSYPSPVSSPSGGVFQAYRAPVPGPAYRPVPAGMSPTSIPEHTTVVNYAVVQQPVIVTSAGQEGSKRHSADLSQLAQGVARLGFPPQQKTEQKQKGQRNHNQKCFISNGITFCC